jgi:hypothetical protein
MYFTMLHPTIALDTNTILRPTIALDTGARMCPIMAIAEALYQVE